MTSSLRFGLLSLFATAGFSVAGCDPGTSSGPAQRPIEPTEATPTINQRVDLLVAGLGDTTAKLDTTDSTTVATGSIDQALGSSSSCPVTGSTSDGSTSTATGAVDDTPQSTTEALDDFLHQVAQEAKDHVFRDEFIEFSDGNQVVYKVDPAAACGTSSTCLDKLTANPIRFVVTANTDDSLNVSLLVGEARRAPGTALLSQTKVSVRINLAEAMEAIRLFVDAEDQQDFPERLAGVVEGSIEKRAANDFVITGSVIEKFDLLVGQAKGKPVAVTVQPTNPTMQLAINSNTNTLGYALNYGAVDARVAGAAVCDDSCGDKEKTGTFSGHVGGYTLGLTLAKGAEELTVSGIGLGNDTAYVALNDDRLGTLDLNPNNGRKVSVTFKKTAEGTLVTFDPALDIRLALMLNKLSESLRVDMPEWLNDEIFDVMLGGAAKPQVLVPAATCDANGNSTTKSQLKVVTGTLKLSASSLASPVEVSAGMCLLPVEGVDSDANPMSQVKADVCQ
jgi:hypothetical protein